MEISINNNGMISGRIGGIKSKPNLIYKVIGDYKILYCYNDKTYIIERIDEQKFDGTENLGTRFFGKINIPKTLDEIVEFLINSSISTFTKYYSDDENYNSDFIEFEYKVNDENDQIKVYPIYLKDFTKYTINLETDIDEELGLIELRFEPERKLRKLSEYEKLCLETLTLISNKYNIKSNYHIGLYKEDCICISKNNNIWEVYLAKNTSAYNGKCFDNCCDACIEIINMFFETKKMIAIKDFLYMIGLCNYKKLLEGSEEKMDILEPKNKKRTLDNK